MNNKIVGIMKTELSADKITDYNDAYSALGAMRLSVYSLTAEELIDQTTALINLLEDWIKFVQDVEEKLDILVNQEK